MHGWDGDPRVILLEHVRALLSRVVEVDRVVGRVDYKGAVTEGVVLLDGDRCKPICWFSVSDLVLRVAQECVVLLDVDTKKNATSD